MCMRLIKHIAIMVLCLSLSLGSIPTYAHQECLGYGEANHLNPSMPMPRKCITITIKGMATTRNAA